MNNGAKGGITTAKKDIIEVYGKKAHDDMQTFGTFIGDQMLRNKPQDMANAILQLIQMKDGTRPLRFPLNKIAEGADHACLEGLNPLKSQWAKNIRLQYHISYNKRIFS